MFEMLTIFTVACLFGLVLYLIPRAYQSQRDKELRDKANSSGVPVLCNDHFQKTLSVYTNKMVMIVEKSKCAYCLFDNIIKDVVEVEYKKRQKQNRKGYDN